MKCFSIGYQGRSLTEFCSTLLRNSIKLVIDVRERAWSYRPDFRKKAVGEALRKHGIEYQHWSKAGNPFRPRGGEKVDPRQCALRYRKYLEQNLDIIDRLEETAIGKPTAVLCYEASREDCHRGILLAVLENRNPEIESVDL
jgi:uncharacterized protein (DUF488 family)